MPTSSRDKQRPDKHHTHRFSAECIVSLIHSLWFQSPTPPPPLPPVVLYYLPQISEDGAITPIPYNIDFFSIQIAIGSRIGKQVLFSCCPSSGISMPDIFKYLGQGGGGDKKACICIDLFPYTLCRKCIKLWLHLNLKKMLC